MSDQKPFPRLCKDCRFSREEWESSSSLACINAVVNANDPYALASKVRIGSSCIIERGKGFFSNCGKKKKKKKESFGSLRNHK